MFIRVGDNSAFSLGRSASILVMACLAAGCFKVGPDFKTPPAQVESKWMESQDSELDPRPPDYRDWWSVFSDPSMVRLIDQAYRQNLDLRTAGVKVIEARAQLGIAIGEFFPQQQTLSAAVSYNRIPLSNPFLINISTYWQDEVAAQATWEIDLWGKLRRAIESADDAFLASVANYDDVLVTLIADVASDYVQIRTVERQIAIAQDNIERQKVALKIANAKFKYGTATKLDVYQAENVLGATEATIPQLTINLVKAKNALSVLLGMPPGPLDKLMAGNADIPTAPERVLAGIPEDLLRRRPDVRRAELQAAAQCAQIGFAKADLLPAFVLIGNVATISTNIGGSSLSNIFSAGTLAFNAGPSVQWNFLNYGQITNNVRVQDARFQELLIGYQNAVLNAQEDVENGLTSFIESRQQAKYLQYSVDAANGALRIAIIQYRQGIAQFTTVLTAEENLYQAENDLALAQGSIDLGLISAYRALGGGWEVGDGNDFIPAQTEREMSDRTNWGTLLTPGLLKPTAPGLPSSQDRLKPLVRPPEM